jgi:hypothetical protein
MLHDELNALPNVKFHIDTASSALQGDANPWQFRVTFLEPVGALPLLESNDAEVTQIVQGQSTLDRSFGSLV